MEEWEGGFGGKEKEFVCVTGKSGDERESERESLVLWGEGDTIVRKFGAEKVAARLMGRG